MLLGGRDDDHPLWATRKSAVPVSHSDSVEVCNFPQAGHFDLLKCTIAEITISPAFFETNVVGGAHSK